MPRLLFAAQKRKLLLRTSLSLENVLLPDRERGMLLNEMVLPNVGLKCLNLILPSRADAKSVFPVLTRLGGRILTTVARAPQWSPTGSTRHSDSRTRFGLNIPRLILLPRQGDSSSDMLKPYSAGREGGGHKGPVTQASEPAAINIGAICRE